MGLEKINEFRKMQGLSIEELSLLSGVPKSTLAKIAAGITTNPNIDTVKAIARALHCSLDDFDDQTKKAPAPAEPGTGELADAKAESFYRLLIREGYLAEGEDFTDAQVEILQGVLQILNAAFPRRKAPEGSNSRKVG